MKLSSDVVGASNDEKNFLHKILLTNTQVLKLCKASANDSSANLTLSKTHLHEIGQSGTFVGRLLRPLLKTGLPLIGSVLKPLGKSILRPIGLTVPASETDAAIHKKMFGSGVTTLIIPNEEMNDIIKIIKSLEESSLLIKAVRETIKNEGTEQNG